MIEVRITAIRDLDDASITNVIKTLSPVARERLEKKKEARLHLSSLCAYSLLTDVERADLAFTPSGIPFFKTLDADISISHSKTHACVAISDKKTTRVGIDVEEKSTAPRIATRFLTPNEQKIFECGAPFVEIWTKKEALFKFLKNDSLALSTIDSASPEQYSAALYTSETDDYFLTLCTVEGEKVTLI